MEGVVVGTAFIVGHSVGGPGVFCSAEGDVVVLGVVHALLDMDDDGAVALLDGGVVVDIWLYTGLQEVSVVVEARTTFAGRLPHLKLVAWVLL